jgi:hypothetical protein
MTAVLFDYPKNAAFGRVLPKSKIYQHGSLKRSVKQLFVQQVEQVVWQHKLARETINLNESKAVPEIQVFSIALKAGELNTEVLRYIDMAIRSPIIFELRFDGKVKSVATFKRPSEADASKWVISEYFESGWVPSSTPRKPLPMVLNLDDLYAQLLTPLMPHPARLGENLKAWVERMELICSLNRKLEKCEARLRKEKQFNRKVAINAELRDLKQELEGLFS